MEAGPEAPYVPPLDVRVMRLSAPRLATRAVPMLEPVDAAMFADPPACTPPMEPQVWDALTASYAPDPSVPPSHVSVAEEMLLPSSFLPVAVGDTFQALVVVVNTSSAPVSGVRLVMEMHTEKTERLAATSFKLADVTAPGPLAPGAELTAVAHYVVPALAMHALVCRVRSEPPGTTAREHWMAKYVIFLMQAIPVSSGTAYALHPDVHIRERTWVRIQIRNVSPRPLRLDTLTMEASDVWTITAAPLLPGTLLMPKDVYQALIELVPRKPWVMDLLRQHREGLTGARKPVSLAMMLGRLFLAWRVPGGEPGQLQVGPLVRRMTVDPLPEGLYAELYHMPDAQTTWQVDKATDVRLRFSVGDVLGPWQSGTPLTHDEVPDAGAPAPNDTPPAETTQAPQPRVFQVEADGAWTTAYVLGPHCYTVPASWHENVSTFDVTLSVVPLQMGAVRAGGVTLYFLPAPGAARRVVRHWACIGEWEVHSD